MNQKNNNRQRQQATDLSPLEKLTEAARQRSDFDDDVFFGYAEHQDDPITALRDFALGRHRDGERTILKAARQAAVDLLAKALGEDIEPSKLAAFEGGDGSFPITSVHRDDLVEMDFDVSNVSDETMRDLAEGVANAHRECSYFWHSLDDFAISLGIPPKPVDRKAGGNRAT